jgi:hypothetical protein
MTAPAPLSIMNQSSGAPFAHLLLGQGFLQRLKSWRIDNATHELVLEQEPPARPVQTAIMNSSRCIGNPRTFALPWLCHGCLFSFFLVFHRLQCLTTSSTKIRSFG